MLPPVPVPAPQYETRQWHAQTDGMASRARIKRLFGAYDSCLPARIAQLEISLPTDLQADVAEAEIALARFDSHAQKVLGMTSPSLAPMSAILLRTESASSSQIENLTAGPKQLALAELGQSTSVNAQAVVANVRAMEATFAHRGDLDAGAIATMHAHLLQGQRGWEHHAGKYRDQLVWIGGSSISPIGAKHIAPQAEHVPAAIDDLAAFIARDDLPILAQAAIAHAQFQTIHPFVDGNGRTGRATIHHTLRAKGLLTHTVAPLSAGLLRQTEHYFAALDDYRRGDGRAIVERFAEAARFAATSGAHLVDDLAAQLVSDRERLAGLRSDAAAWRLLPHLIAQPVVNAAAVKRLLPAGDSTAHRALGQLTAAGVLTTARGGYRDRIWQHDLVLGVLGDYAAAIHRR